MGWYWLKQQVNNDSTVKKPQDFRLLQIQADLNALQKAANESSKTDDPQVIERLINQARQIKEKMIKAGRPDAAQGLEKTIKAWEQQLVKLKQSIASSKVIVESLNKILNQFETSHNVDEAGFQNLIQKYPEAKKSIEEQLNKLRIMRQYYQLKTEAFESHSFQNLMEFMDKNQSVVLGAMHPRKQQMEKLFLEAVNLKQESVYVWKNYPMGNAAKSGEVIMPPNSYFSNVENRKAFMENLTVIAREKSIQDPKYATFLQNSLSDGLENDIPKFFEALEHFNIFFNEGRYSSIGLIQDGKAHRFFVFDDHFINGVNAEAEKIKIQVKERQKQDPYRDIDAEFSKIDKLSGYFFWMDAPEAFIKRKIFEKLTVNLDTNRPNDPRMRPWFSSADLLILADTLFDKKYITQVEQENLKKQIQNLILNQTNPNQVYKWRMTDIERDKSVGMQALARVFNSFARDTADTASALRAEAYRVSSVPVVPRKVISSLKFRYLAEQHPELLKRFHELMPNGSKAAWKEIATKEGYGRYADPTQFFEEYLAKESIDRPFLEWLLQNTLLSKNQGVAQHFLDFINNHVANLQYSESGTKFGERSYANSAELAKKSIALLDQMHGNKKDWVLSTLELKLDEGFPNLSQEQTNQYFQIKDALSFFLAHSFDANSEFINNPPLSSIWKDVSGRFDPVTGIIKVGWNKVVEHKDILLVNGLRNFIVQGFNDSEVYTSGLGYPQSLEYPLLLQGNYLPVLLRNKDDLELLKGQMVLHEVDLKSMLGEDQFYNVMATIELAMSDKTQGLDLTSDKVKNLFAVLSAQPFLLQKVYSFLKFDPTQVDQNITVSDLLILKQYLSKNITNISNVLGANVQVQDYIDQLNVLINQRMAGTSGNNWKEYYLDLNANQKLLIEIRGVLERYQSQLPKPDGKVSSAGGDTYDTESSNKTWVSFKDWAEYQATAFPPSALILGMLGGGRGERWFSDWITYMQSSDLGDKALGAASIPKEIASKYLQQLYNLRVMMPLNFNLIVPVQLGQQAVDWAFFGGSGESLLSSAGSTTLNIFMYTRFFPYWYTAVAKAIDDGDYSTAVALWYATNYIAMKGGWNSVFGKTATFDREIWKLAQKIPGLRQALANIPENLDDASRSQRMLSAMDRFFSQGTSRVLLEKALNKFNDFQKNNPKLEDWSRAYEKFANRPAGKILKTSLKMILVEPLSEITNKQNVEQFVEKTRSVQMLEKNIGKLAGSLNYIPRVNAWLEKWSQISPAMLDLFYKELPKGLRNSELLGPKIEWAKTLFRSDRDLRKLLGSDFTVDELILSRKSLELRKPFTGVSEGIKGSLLIQQTSNQVEVLPYQFGSISGDMQLYRFLSGTDFSTLKASVGLKGDGIGKGELHDLPIRRIFLTTDGPTRLKVPMRSNASADIHELDLYVDEADLKKTSMPEIMKRMQKQILTLQDVFPVTEKQTKPDLSQITNLHQDDSIKGQRAEDYQKRSQEVINRFNEYFDPLKTNDLQGLRELASNPDKFWKDFKNASIDFVEKVKADPKNYQKHLLEFRAWEMRSVYFLTLQKAIKGDPTKLNADTVKKAAQMYREQIKALDSFSNVDLNVIAQIKTGQGKTLIMDLLMLERTLLIRTGQFTEQLGEKTYGMTSKPELVNQFFDPANNEYKEILDRAGVRVGKVTDSPQMSKDDLKKAYEADCVFGDKKMITDVGAGEIPRHWIRPGNVVFDEIDAMLVLEAKINIIITGPDQGKNFIIETINKYLREKTYWNKLHDEVIKLYDPNKRAEYFDEQGKINTKGKDSLSANLNDYAIKHSRDLTNDVRQMVEAFQLVDALEKNDTEANILKNRNMTIKDGKLLSKAAEGYGQPDMRAGGGFDEASVVVLNRRRQLFSMRSLAELLESSNKFSEFQKIVARRFEGSVPFPEELHTTADINVFQYIAYHKNRISGMSGSANIMKNFFSVLYNDPYLRSINARNLAFIDLPVFTPVVEIRVRDGKLEYREGQTWKSVRQKADADKVINRLREDIRQVNADKSIKAGATKAKLKIYGDLSDPLISNFLTQLSQARAKDADFGKEPIAIDNEMPTRVFYDRQHKYEQVAKDAVDEAFKNGKPVKPILINVQEDGEVELIKKEIEKVLESRKLTNKITLQTASAKNTSLTTVLQRAEVPGTITINTLFSRGTDIKTKDAIFELPEFKKLLSGNLHVSYVGVNAYEALHIQAYGRAPRADKPGSYRLYMSTDETILNKEASDKAASKTALDQKFGLSAETPMQTADSQARVAENALYDLLYDEKAGVVRNVWDHYESKLILEILRINKEGVQDLVVTGIYNQLSGTLPSNMGEYFKVLTNTYVQGVVAAVVGQSDTVSKQHIQELEKIFKVQFVGNVGKVDFSKLEGKSIQEAAEILNKVVFREIIKRRGIDFKFDDMSSELNSKLRENLKTVLRNNWARYLDRRNQLKGEQRVYSSQSEAQEQADMKKMYETNFRQTIYRMMEESANVIMPKGTFKGTGDLLSNGWVNLSVKDSDLNPTSESPVEKPEPSRTLARGAKAFRNRQGFVRLSGDKPVRFPSRTEKPVEVKVDQNPQGIDEAKALSETTDFVKQNEKKIVEEYVRVVNQTTNPAKKEILIKMATDPLYGGVTGMLVGLVAMEGFNKVAEKLGIHNPAIHFGLGLIVGHAANHGMQNLLEGLGSGKLLESLKVIPQSLKTVEGSLNLLKASRTGVLNAFRTGIPGMGWGVLSSKAVTELARLYGTSPETAEHLGSIGFFAPDALRLSGIALTRTALVRQSLESGVLSRMTARLTAGRAASSLGFLNRFAKGSAILFAADMVWTGRNAMFKSDLQTNIDNVLVQYVELDRQFAPKWHPARYIPKVNDFFVPNINLSAKAQTAKDMLPPQTEQAVEDQLIIEAIQAKKYILSEIGKIRLLNSDPGKQSNEIRNFLNKPEVQQAMNLIKAVATTPTRNRTSNYKALRVFAVLDNGQKMPFDQLNPDVLVPQGRDTKGAEVLPDPRGITINFPAEISEFKILAGLTPENVSYMSHQLDRESVPVLKKEFQELIIKDIQIRSRGQQSQLPQMLKNLSVQGRTLFNQARHELLMEARQKSSEFSQKVKVLMEGNRPDEQKKAEFMRLNREYSAWLYLKTQLQ